MRNAYFIMKEELPCSKLSKINQLLNLQGNKEIKFFQHHSERVAAEIFTAVGHTVENTFITDLRNARCYGLLVDDLTDISVKELMVAFVQYIDGCGHVQTKFLFVRDLLKDSPSANAITIHRNIMDGLRSLGIDTEKLASICTDGAPVMVGETNGLAGLLRRSNPQIVNFHCICHRLALATVDTLSTKTLSYVNNVHDWCRQVWQLLENSPKKMAVFIKVQLSQADCQTSNSPQSQKKRKKAAIKLKKACKTRWLSFHQSVKSIKRSLQALLLTLEEIDVPASIGLHKKMHTAKFIGCVYMLDEVLPILASLSVVFQKGQIAYASMKGSIEQARFDLDELLKYKSFLKDMKESGILKTLNLQLDTYTEGILKSLQEKYIHSLLENIDSRFKKCQDVFDAFKIFNPKLLPWYKLL